MRGSTRREFLAESLLAAAALPALPAAAAGPAPRRAGPNERLRVAVVGVRGQGRVHVSKWSALPDAEVVAVCDPDSNVVGDAMGAVERRTGRKPQHYADIRKLLEDKTVDVVSIATPNHWHVLASLWAVQAGKDVYVEKPLGHNLWEQRKLVEAARKYDRLVQMGNYPRSLESARSAVEFLKSGKFGRILLARGLCYNRRGSIGKKPDGPVPPGVDYDLWLGPAPERPFNPNRFHYNWHWNWDYGGGELANNGIYYLDMARWALGKSDHPRRILSVGGRLGYEDDGQTPNTQIVLYDYGDAQILQEVRGLPTGKYKDVAMGNVFHCENGYVASSISGMAAFDLRGELVQRFSGSGDHFRNFADAVKARDRARLNSEVLEGHLSTSLCHLGNISYRLGELRPLSQDAPFGAHEEANEAYRRMREHLVENGLEAARTPVRVGRALEFDSRTETFVNDAAATALLRREYRKPFVVPENV
jgi:predicted dehydrogenase